MECVRLYAHPPTHRSLLVAEHLHVVCYAGVYDGVHNHTAPPRPHAPTPPVGSQYSCQPTVKLHILPLVWIFTL